MSAAGKRARPRGIARVLALVIVHPWAISACQQAQVGATDASLEGDPGCAEAACDRPQPPPFLRTAAEEALEGPGTGGDDASPGPHRTEPMTERSGPATSPVFDAGPSAAPRDASTEARISPSPMATLDASDSESYDAHAQVAVDAQSDEDAGEPDCVPGARMCTEALEYVCHDSGIWVPARTCALGCAADGCAECPGDGDQCLDRSLAITCRDGQITAREDCRSEGKTCSEGRCIDLCTPNDQRCIPARNAYEVCRLDGSWGPVVECFTAPSLDEWAVCRNDQCVQATSEYVGHVDPEVLDWPGRRALAPDSWQLARVELAQEMKLFGLRAELAEVPFGQVRIRMALWQEDGSLRAPGAFVAATADNVARTGSNGLFFDLEARPTLQPGAFWVGVNVSGTDALLRERAGAGLTASFVGRYDAELASIPGIAPPATTANGVDLGLSVLVRPTH